MQQVGWRTGGPEMLGQHSRVLLPQPERRDAPMCGRYLLHGDVKLVGRAFGIEEFSFTPQELTPRFIIAPS
jgi:hypothetical protein